MRIVLASKSPRRKEILSSLGVDFEIITKETDESSEIHDPCELVKELSYRKGKAVFDEINDNDTLVISSDTVVTLDNIILGKPKSKDDAVMMLKSMSDKEHTVVSGVTLMYKNKVISDYEITYVKFAKISDEVIEKYVATGEPMDKAGAYGIQGLASLMIEGSRGCYFNVGGFPIYKFKKMLDEIGLDAYSITKLR